MRVSVKNIEARVEIYGDLIQGLTGKRPELQLTIGSSTYGNLFRLSHVERDESGKVINYKPFWGSWDGSMGFTRREAWETLGATNETLTRVIEFMS
jgi:hypothetical protein